MLDRYIHDMVLSFLVGCIACLSMASVNNADGRVFTMDLRGSSSLQGLRGAERACAMQDARLASGAELRRAVLECSFSACTRGWLQDGTVGTTECRNAGSSLTAMQVRTENTTDHMAHLNAFCIKDTGVPCGDPPSFPNTRLQGQAGFELGDELLYVCAPGYRMPSGNTAFSLLCDSCGEWYGLVQMCLKDESEIHVDYEDRFPEGYGAPDQHGVTDEDYRDHVPGEAQRHAAFPAARPDTQKQQDLAVIFAAAGRGGPERRDRQGEEARGEEEEEVAAALSRPPAAEGAPGVASRGAAAAPGVGGGEEQEEEEDVHPASEQERVALIGSDAAAAAAAHATTAPVSQLSQKHMFWFPSEAFNEDPAPNDPVTRIATTDGGPSEEESEEGRPDADADDLDDGHDDGEQKGYYDHGDDHDHRDDREERPHQEQQDDHDDSHHDDHDDHGDHDDHDDGEDHDVHDNSRQEEEEQEEEEDLLSQRVKPYNPGQRDNADRYGRYDDDVDPRDHYDMGEHDDDDRRERDRVLYGGERKDADVDEEEEDRYDEDREREDAEEESEDPHEHDEHPEESEEDSDGETGEHADDDGGDGDDPDRYDDHDHTDDETAETDEENDENDEHDDHDSHEDHDEEHEDVDDDDDDDDVQRHQVDFPLATDEPTTQEEAGRKPTSATDQSWLDGYPIGPEEAEKGGSTEEEAEVSREQEEEEEEPAVVVVVDATVAPGEADVLPERPSRGPDSEERDRVGDAWPGRFRPREPTPPAAGSHESRDSVLYPDALDYDHTDDPALAWDEEEDPSDRPFFPDPDPGATTREGGAAAADAENEVPLTGEAGERAPVEGEKGEAVCTGEDCPPPPPPPPTSSSRGPVVAAVIVAICAVAMVAVVGAWLYRRRLQKNSMYQLNGKGHSQCPPDQQIEMQQKV